jgi:hypothetical protein
VKCVKLRASEIIQLENRPKRTTFQMVATEAMMQQRMSSIRVTEPVMVSHKPNNEIVDEVADDKIANTKQSPRRDSVAKKFMNPSFVQKLISVRRKNKLVKDKKSAHFLFILVLTFFVCWVRLSRFSFRTFFQYFLSFVLIKAPYTVFTLIKPMCKHCINDIIYEVSFWMLWLNSTLNPIIYPFLHVVFRSAFLDIFRRIFQCKKARKSSSL